jgi:histidine triad (HIT) family protein
LDDEEYASLQLFAKRVARALKRATGCKRVGVAVLGMEVPHAHIHLVPLNTERDLDMFGEKLQLAPERMQQLAEAIANQLD